MSILVAACGGKDEESTVGKAKDDRASATRDEAASGVAPTGPVKAADDRMANAVATSKTAAAVDLRYALQTKPEVGQPFEVELAFHPRVTADALEIEATGITGLTVVSGGSTRFEKVVAGERYAAKVLAQAGAAGLYYIGVSAKMVTSVQTDVRVEVRNAANWARVDDGFDVAAPVGRVKSDASPYGVMDGAGNVMEWVNDWYLEGAYAAASERNPESPEYGTYKVLRGAAYTSPGSDLRITARSKMMLDFRDETIGFRCAQSSAENGQSCGGVGPEKIIENRSSRGSETRPK